MLQINKCWLKLILGQENALSNIEAAIAQIEAVTCLTFELLTSADANDTSVLKIRVHVLLFYVKA